jgi:hypothetical protein
MQYTQSRLRTETPYYESLANDTPPATLFPYTSQSGLIRLVNDKSVSASNIHFFNDAQEFAYAVQAVDSIIYQLKSNTDNALELQFYEYLPDAVERASHVNIHVFCLTEHADQLSLWRGYCPSGNGIAVGFQWEQIKDKVRTHGFRIAKCIYDRQSQESLIRELLGYVIPLLHEADATAGISNRVKTVELVANHFVNRFWERAPMMKHPSFAEEREWKLISGLVNCNHVQMRIRPGVSTLVPYFDLDVSSEDKVLQIGDMVIGPTPHQNLATNGVTALLCRYQVQWTQVRSSTIPYRTW